MFNSYPLERKNRIKKEFYVYYISVQSEADVQLPKISLRRLASSNTNRIDAEIDNQIRNGEVDQMDDQANADAVEDQARDMHI